MRVQRGCGAGLATFDRLGGCDAAGVNQLESSRTKHMLANLDQKLRTSEDVWHTRDTVLAEWAPNAP